MTPDHEPRIAQQTAPGSLLEKQTARRIATAGLSATAIGIAANVLLACFRDGHKALILGNGGSAADAQHMAAELIGRIRRVRPPLPAVALSADASVVTALANDFGYDEVFARQVAALGQVGDVAVVFSTSGTSPSALRAVEVARGAGMRVIGITGAPGVALACAADVAITVDQGNPQRIQEAHLVALHAICEAVEASMFSSEHAVPTAHAGGTVVALPRLLDLRAAWLATGRTVVWTNGVFDLLHRGHIRSLEVAKSYGDVLIVGINSDASTRALKGDSRPVVPEVDRATVLAALGSVDYVTIFADYDPCRILALLQPEVHCKGSDYADVHMPERAIVEAYGGRVELVPLVPGFSTTALLRRAIA